MTERSSEAQERDAEYYREGIAEIINLGENYGASRGALISYLKQLERGNGMFMFKSRTALEPAPAGEGDGG